MRTVLSVILAGCFVVASCLSCDNKHDSPRTSPSDKEIAGYIQLITAAIEQKEYHRAISIHHISVPQDRKEQVDAKLRAGLVGADEGYWLVVGRSLGLATQDIVLETLTTGSPGEVAACLGHCPAEAIDWCSNLKLIIEQSGEADPRTRANILHHTLRLLHDEDFPAWPSGGRELLLEFLIDILQSPYDEHSATELDELIGQQACWVAFKAFDVDRALSEAWKKERSRSELGKWLSEDKKELLQLKAPQPQRIDPSTTEEASPAAGAFVLRLPVLYPPGWERLEFSWSWQESDPGQPRISKVTKEVTPSDFWLTKEDGLPADTAIDAIAQLRTGDMVFATNKGMSVWHKGVIRTYTGETYSVEQKKLIPGNSGLPGNSVQDLLVARDGSLWVATGIGVCRIRRDKWEDKWDVLTVRGPAVDPMGGWEREEASGNLDDVLKLFETAGGNIILGSHGAGISIVDPQTNSVRIIYLNKEMNNRVTGIGEDKDKNLWFGVFGLGVLRYDGKEFKLYTDEAEWIPDKSIRSFCLDHEGNIWVGTHKGLGVRLANKQAKVYTEADVLPDNFVDHLFVRKNGEVWISTGDGAVIWAGGTWRYPTYRDWGGSWLGVCYEANDGSFWIGGPGPIRNPTLKMTDEKPVD